MKIKDIYNSKKLVVSFEIFPPNAKFPVETIYDTIDALTDLKPDFISVTYGAGGTAQGRTAEITSRIKNVNNTETMAHLTCIGATKERINEITNELKENGVENILALRGDIPRDQLQNNDFNYANELVTHLKKSGDFSIAGAF